jgi:hypothetical protein
MQLAHHCTRKLFTVLLSILAVPAAHAAYIINVSEVDPNVVTTGSGSINTTALTFAGNSSTSANVNPSSASLSVGATTTSSITNYTGASGPANFGAGDEYAIAGGSGSLVGIIGKFSVVTVPQGYVSGTDLGTSTTTYANQSFSGLGINPGTYTYTWGTGPTADSLTVQVGPTPEPASLSLLAPTSLALLRRRQRASLLATNN